MINIDFSLAISLYAAVFLGIMLAAWLLGKKDGGRDLSLDARFIWHCGVCAYTYINTRDDIFSLCPRCGSYNKK